MNIPETEASSPEEKRQALTEVHLRMIAQAERERKILWVSVLVAIPITLLILWMILVEVNWLTGGKWGE